MWHYLPKICALYSDRGLDGDQEGSCRTINVRSGCHIQDINGDKSYALSMMPTQNFSDCSSTHDPKRKSCGSQNLSRTSSCSLSLMIWVWFCSCRTNSKFCHSATDWDNTRLNIKLNKKWKHAFSNKLIIPLMINRHIDPATFYSCKQSSYVLVICQAPSFNSSTQMTTDTKKTLKLDTNRTGNVNTNLNLRCVQIIIFAMEKPEVLLLLLLLLCVCILTSVIWHAK
jgi:hypothetical protein